MDFTKEDYRLLIMDMVDDAKAIGKSLTYSQMADACLIQKPYFSKVMNNKASLNQDQMYLLCKFLKVNEEEREYMFLLLEFEKSAIEERRVEIALKIKKLQSVKSKTDEHINAKSVAITKESLEEYYLDPWIQVIHMSLTIPKFQKEISLLKTKLHLPDHKFEKIISFLMDHGFIELKDKKVKVLQKSVHLPRESTCFWPWKSAITTMGLEKSKMNTPEDTYNFSVVFSADENCRKEIQKMFMKFLKEIELKVTASTSKNLYQMNFDLINWL